MGLSFQLSLTSAAYSDLQPETRTKNPITGTTLRLKELIAVKFSEKVEEGGGEGEKKSRETSSNRFFCPSCYSDFVYQDVYLLKK